MKAAIYTRVSTDTQSVENQLSCLRQVAELRGLQIICECSDEGISGAKGRRERQGLDNLIRRAIKREFDVIMVWSVDRLGRNLADLLVFLSEIQAANCDLYLHQQGIDTSTVAGKMMFQMCGVFAEFERGLIRERIKAGQRRAVSSGKLIGRPASLTPDLIGTIKTQRNAGEAIKMIARSHSIGVGTVYKALRHPSPQPSA